MTRLSVHLDVLYEVEGSLPDPGDDDASTDFLATLLETLLETGALELTDHSDPEWPTSLDPQGWRVEVEGYGDLTVGPEAFEGVEDLRARALAAEARAERAERERQWLSDDQERLDRTRREALEQVEALRVLLGRMADDILPVLRQQAPSWWNEGDWRGDVARELSRVGPS